MLWFLSCCIFSESLNSVLVSVVVVMLLLKGSLVVSVNVICRLKCVVDADGKHSALFACVAELFQHLDIEVILLRLPLSVWMPTQPVIGTRKDDILLFGLLPLVAGLLQTPLPAASVFCIFHQSDVVFACDVVEHLQTFSFSCYFAQHPAFYRVGQLKRGTLILSISLPIIDRFSKSFHCHTLQTICNNVIIIYPTTQ